LENGRQVHVKTVGEFRQKKTYYSSPYCLAATVKRVPCIYYIAMILTNTDDAKSNLVRRADAKSEPRTADAKSKPRTTDAKSKSSTGC
jgi:hypothetical protein